MSSDWIKHKEAEFFVQAQEFSTAITARPVPLGLTAAQATTLATAVTAYVAAFNVANSDATRTPVAVQTKDTTEPIVVAIMRTYGRIIQSNPAVTASQKTALGLTVRSPRGPLPPPSSQPLLSVIGSMSRSVTVRIFDPVTGKKAHPAGVVGAEIFSWVVPAGAGPDATPPADFEQWR